MLHITPQAGVAIATLTSQEGVAESGGLRLERLAPERDGQDSTMTLSVAALGEEGDVQITESVSGSRVFLDPLTAEYLDDKTLDVADTVEGEAVFSLASHATE